MKSFLLSILILISIYSQVLAESYSDSVVTITATTLGFDYDSPWKKKPVHKNVLSGFIIKNNMIITDSHSLANHVLVEVSKHGKERKYQADVILKDYRCGLAVLRVNDESFYKDLKPVSYYSDGSIIGKKAVIPKWDNQGIMKEYSSELFKSLIEFYELYGAVLIYHMTTDMNSGGEGEPVFVDGGLIGMTTWYDSKNKIMKVIALDVIKRMQKDLDDGSYDGIPFFYLEEAFLEGDENLREYLSLDENNTGILINRVPPKTSGSDVLKSGDVILSINGVNIDDNGLYQSDYCGKLNYYGLICLNHFVGEILKMEIIRGKKRMEVSFKLMPIADECFLIPPESYDAPPKYCIIGGLVFQELTRGYLKTWGEKWVGKANKRFMYYYENYSEWPTTRRRRIVILNRVLPASVNSGYHDRGNLILQSVNGIEVKDLEHVKSITDKSESKHIRFNFMGRQRIVLDRKRVENSEKGILQIYNIHLPYYLGD